VEFILNKEKETQGTWRFKEDKEDHPLQIYLTKEYECKLHLNVKNIFIFNLILN